MSTDPYAPSKEARKRYSRLVTDGPTRAARATLRAVGF
jgi:hypothetical protein